MPLPTPCACARAASACEAHVDGSVLDAARPVVVIGAFAASRHTHCRSCASSVIAELTRPSRSWVRPRAGRSPTRGADAEEGSARETHTPVREVNLQLGG